MKDWKSQFREWLKEIVPGGRIEPYVQFHGHVPAEWGMDGNEVRAVDTEEVRYHRDLDGQRDRAIAVGSEKTLKVRVFTKDNEYSISASENRLGGISHTRKPRAGEDWKRSSDLPDGKFSRDTWERIKNAIIQDELVKVMKRQERIKDEAPASVRS